MRHCVSSTSKPALTWTFTTQRSLQRGSRRWKGSLDHPARNGYYNVCAKKNIYIQPHELLVGGVGFKPRCGILNPDSASGVIAKELDTISTRPFDPFYLSEEGKKVYTEKVQNYWKNKCVFDRWNLMLPEDAKRLRANGAIFIDRKAVRGYGENTPGWMRILTKGLAAIRKEAEDALAKLDDANPGDLEKSFFYKAEIKAADAVILLAHRHADLAERWPLNATIPFARLNF